MCIRDRVRPDAITRIKSSLVLEQIAKEENIEITDADVDAEIEKMATMYNMEADKLKEYMGEDEKENMKQDLAVDVYKRQGYRSYIRNTGSKRSNN